MSAEKERTYEANRSLKRRLVAEGRAHAALVYDGDEAVAWCEYGTPAELPNIYHRKQYEEELDVLPDYRITCIFVDKRYRRQGSSKVALQGALDLITAAGGGVVAGYPHDTGGRKKSVLYNGTRTLFERSGFEFVRSKGRAIASFAVPCPDPRGHDMRYAQGLPGSASIRRVSGHGCNDVEVDVDATSKPSLVRRARPTAAGQAGPTSLAARRCLSPRRAPRTGGATWSACSVGVGKILRGVGVGCSSARRPTSPRTRHRDWTTGTPCGSGRRSPIPQYRRDCSPMSRSNPSDGPGWDPVPTFHE